MILNRHSPFAHLLLVILILTPIDRLYRVHSFSNCKKNWPIYILLRWAETHAKIRPFYFADPARATIGNRKEITQLLNSLWMV